MPSSISSSDLPLQFERPGFTHRQTASDRPGVAQPVPERHIPDRPWGRVWLFALLLFGLLLTGWEMYWRAWGAAPAYANSNGSWAEQRRRIDQGEANKLVIVGSSRVLFDVQLPTWEKVTGERPIQLALEGTSPVPVLEDLADDPNFTGRLLIGVAPDLFFSGFAYRAEALKYFHKQGPSQRAGHWLSQHFVEPYFAFYDPDFALGTVIKRQDWPVREGTNPRLSVRKLAVSEADRNTHMWSKVENDVAYRELARRVWAQNFTGPPPPPFATPEKAKATIAKQIDRARIALEKMRARGVRAVFVRMPSVDAFYAFEEKALPRAATWEPLLQATQTPGIHFDDYPQMQGYTLPEWSHLSAADAIKITEQLAPLVQQKLSAGK